MYQKTISITTGNVNVGVGYTLGINDIADVISISGTITANNNDIVTFEPTYAYNAIFSWFSTSEQKIYVQVIDNAFANRTAKITIQYIKTSS